MSKEKIMYKYLSAIDISNIHQFINDVRITDNNIKATNISRHLTQLGFVEIGCGTNRIVFAKDNYAFKIALDSRGITDNNAEFKISQSLQPFVTINYENTGTISIAELVETMSKEEFDSHWDIILGILQNVSRSFILNDVGPKSFLNWGVRDNGEIVILDYAYLTPITPDMKFNCKNQHCQGALVYNKDFTALKCVCCGRKYALTDIKDSAFNTLLELGFNDEGISDIDSTFDTVALNDMPYNEYGFHE